MSLIFFIKASFFNVITRKERNITKRRKYNINTIYALTQFFINNINKNVINPKMNDKRNNY